MPPAPNSWACNCPTVHPRNKKRCGVCYAWQGGTRFSAATCSSQSSAAKTGNFVVRGKLDSSNNVGEERDQSDDGHSGEDENKIINKRTNPSYHRVSLEEAAAAGCEKCQKEYATGVRTANSHDAHCQRKDKSRQTKKSNGESERYRRVTSKTAKAETNEPHYHQATLEEAASLGCSKCKKELISGIKNTKSHDVGCPRRRGAWGARSNYITVGKNDECSKCKKEQELGKTVPGPHIKGCPMNPKNVGKSACKSLCSTAVLPIGGDPPWRSTGNGWIGRRILYKPNAAKDETRACSKSKFYYGDEAQDDDQTDSSAIKGTIIGFISERDKDSEGNPGFVSSKTGLPAILFHVVFDQNTDLLLNKDFEEWEIKEQCEWIYDETDSDSEDDGSEMQDDDYCANEKDAFEVQEKIQSPKEIRVGVKAAVETKISSKKADSRQDLKNVSPAAGTSFKTTCNQSVSSKSSNRNATSHQKSSRDKAGASVATNPNDRITNGSTANETTKVGAALEEEISCSAEKVTKPDLSNCSSFNEALKSALCSYASNSASRNANNPPPPVPPPFLSHQEESTLRTALAFVMIKARNKQKQKAPDSTAKKITADGGKPIVGQLSRLNPQRDATHNQHGRNQLILGGLLSQPQRQGRVGQLSSKTMLAFDREISHIRDILKLALSSVLPLYKGALDANEAAQSDDKREGGDEDEDKESYDSISSEAGNVNMTRMPSAIYDFEAGYRSLSSATYEKTPVDRHYASLDGLCQHAAMRLARLISEATVKERLDPRALNSTGVKAQNESQEKSSADDAKEKPAGSIITESSRGEDSRGSVRSKQIICDAVVKLLYQDIIGKTLHDEQLYVDYCYHYERRAKERIEKIMAACHVIHRLLFFDQCNSFASECTIAISRTLADIYHNTYLGALDSIADDSTARNAVQADKRKVQVVKPNWLVSRSIYSNDRFERRSRGVDVMFRSKNPVLGGLKRKNAAPSIEDASDTYSIPDVVDVLTVNLLRLLECASEIRLHHHHKSSMLHQSRSNPAADIIKEIRSTNAVELMMPIHLDEAASLYLREFHAHHHNGQPSLLRPSAKLMLRVHFFGLIKKLSEQEV